MQKLSHIIYTQENKEAHYTIFSSPTTHPSIYNASYAALIHKVQITVYQLLLLAQCIIQMNFTYKTY
jgi:hypothetical protein